MVLYRSDADAEAGRPLPYQTLPFRQFVEDMARLMDMISDGPLLVTLVNFSAENLAIVRPLTRYLTKPLLEKSSLRGLSIIFWILVPCFRLSENRSVSVG